MITIVLILIVVIAVAMFIAGFYLRLQYNKEITETVVDDRNPNITKQSISYKVPSNMFACNLTAMWVETYYLNHHYLKCFKENDPSSSEKSMKLLKEEFNIENKEEFSKQLYFFQDASYMLPLQDFISCLQQMLILYDGSEQQIATSIMSSYEKPSYITQFYNFKSAIVPLEGGNTLSIELYGVSMALFILRIGMNAAYCSVSQFNTYRDKMYEEYGTQITDWKHYYDQWLLADLFYKEFSFNDRYAIHMRGIQERVEKLFLDSNDK